MEKTKTLVLEKVNWQSIGWFIGLMAIGIVLPRFVHNQFITGPIINATLFLAAYQLGSGQAIMIGLVPSVVALSSGLLPLPLAPMVPFIMIGNAILVLAFNATRKSAGWRTFGSAAIVASLAKYLFLYLTAIFIIKAILPNNLTIKAMSMMMAWPQLVTALAGAAIAFGVIKVVKSSKEE